MRDPSRPGSVARCVVMRGGFREELEGQGYFHRRRWCCTCSGGSQLAPDLRRLLGVWRHLGED